MLMTQNEIAEYNRILNAGGTYLEYGSGGSTFAALRNSNITKLFSVESDLSFLSRLSEDAEILRNIDNGRATLRWADVGETGEWGGPKTSCKRYLWPSYSLFPHLVGYKPDIVLVDGRFRVACVLACVANAPNSTILVHDYAERYNYRVIEQFVNCITIVDTLLVCTPKKTYSSSVYSSVMNRYAFEPNDRPTLGRRILARVLPWQKPKSTVIGL